jgi:hypothetical protein
MTYAVRVDDIVLLKQLLQHGDGIIEPPLSFPSSFQNEPARMHSMAPLDTPPQPNCSSNVEISSFTST